MEVVSNPNRFNSSRSTKRVTCKFFGECGKLVFHPDFKFLLKQNHLCIENAKLGFGPPSFYFIFMVVKYLVVKVFPEINSGSSIRLLKWLKFAKAGPFYNHRTLNSTNIEPYEL